MDINWPHGTLILKRNLCILYQGLSSHFQGCNGALNGNAWTREHITHNFTPASISLSRLGCQKILLAMFFILMTQRWPLCNSYMTLSFSGIMTTAHRFHSILLWKVKSLFGMLFSGQPFCTKRIT